MPSARQQFQSASVHNAHGVSVMSHSDGVAGAVAAGPVDAGGTTKGTEQPDRFYEQAYRLGRCANLVYPEHRGGDKKQHQQRVRKLVQFWNELNWDELFDRCEPDLDADHPSQQAVELARNLLATATWQAELDHLENDLDDIGASLHRDYRRAIRRKYLQPWGWFSKQRLQDLKRAKEKWRVAHQLWVEVARERIEGGHDEASILKQLLGEDAKVKFVSKDGTEYFLAGDDQHIILCFRGTEATKVSDVVTDLLAWQTTVEESSAKFHNGFWCALDGVWDGLREALTNDRSQGGFRADDQEKRSAQQLWITGHSLGGALATLAAYRIARESNQDSESYDLPEIAGVFTFGQPRVGDGQFKREYKALRYRQADGRDVYLNDRHYRFVNNNDVVTIVPPKPFWILSVLFGRAFSMIAPTKQQATTDQPTASEQPAPPKTPAQDDQVSELTNDNNEKIVIRIDSSHQSESEQQYTAEYSDVGRVVLANRQRAFRLLTPEQSRNAGFWEADFWWPLNYRARRVTSWRFLSLKPCGGFMQRFLPGIPDHSMAGYLEALEKQRQSETRPQTASNDASPT